MHVRKAAAIGVSTLSPVPWSSTGPQFAARGKLCGKSRARSAETRINAPPPSVTRQHCKPTGKRLPNMTGLEQGSTLLFRT
jgi:hypothetical protein